jgi:hypothetical protein
MGGPFDLTKSPLSSPISVLVEDVTDEASVSSFPFYHGPVTEMFPVSSEDVPALTDAGDDNESTSDSDDSSVDSNKGLDFSALLDELNIDQDPTSPSTLSATQIQQITKACIESLETHGCITVSLLNWMREQKFLPSPSSVPTSSTPSDRPSLLSSDKMPSSTAQRHRLTVPQLHRYMGFRKPKDWNEILELSQENVTLSLDDGVVPLELGDVANIKRSRRNKTPIPRPPKFLAAVHMDIGYGDSMQEDAQYETFEITSQDASSSAVLDRSKNHWISAVLNTVCAIL